MTISPELRHAYNFHRLCVSRAHPISAKRSLELARKEVEGGKARYTSSPWVKTAPNHGTLFNGQCQWIEKPENYGLRLVGFADDIDSGIRHKGWYCDTFQDESYRGVVYQLPARNGLAQFVAGYADPYNPGAALIDWSTLEVPDSVAERETARRQIGKGYWHNQYDNAAYWIEAATETAKKEVARQADSFAERMAEKAREHDTAWQAGSMWAQERDEIESSRATIKSLLAERKAARDLGAAYPAICETIRATISSALADITRSREKMRDLVNGDYQTRHEYFGFYPSEELRGAFNDGAGETVI